MGQYRRSLLLAVRSCFLLLPGNFLYVITSDYARFYEIKNLSMSLVLYRRALYSSYFKLHVRVCVRSPQSLTYVSSWGFTLCRLPATRII